MEPPLPLLPGQGAFGLPAFVEHVLCAGYTGPLSLEVFNDVFRQSDARRTAVDALRFLLALEEALSRRLERSPDRPQVALHCPPPPVEPSGYAFVELAVDAWSGPVAAQALTTLGFLHAGQHRSKPVAPVGARKRQRAAQPRGLRPAQHPGAPC